MSDLSFFVLFGHFGTGAFLLAYSRSGARCDGCFLILASAVFSTPEGFFVLFFFAVASVALPGVSVSTDGSLHAVVVLFLLSLLMLTTADIFWAEILLYGYSSLGETTYFEQFVLRLSGRIRAFLRQESFGCAHTVWSLASDMLPVVGFFAPSPTVSSSWDRASSWILRLLLQARVRLTFPPKTPFHPGHLPAVGWAYIIV